MLKGSDPATGVDGGDGCDAGGGRGRTARRRVPSPGGLAMVSEPSQAPTRSASPLRPEPVPARAPPTPSSLTSTTSEPSSAATFTVACVACAYFATFVSASATVKYAVVSAATGSRPSGTST